MRVDIVGTRFAERATRACTGNHVAIRPDHANELTAARSLRRTAAIRDVTLARESCLVYVRSGPLNFSQHLAFLGHLWGHRQAAIPHNNVAWYAIWAILRLGDIDREPPDRYGVRAVLANACEDKEVRSLRRRLVNNFGCSRSRFLFFFNCIHRPFGGRPRQSAHYPLARLGATFRHGVSGIFRRCEQTLAPRRRRGAQTRPVGYHYLKMRVEDQRTAEALDRRRRAPRSVLPSRYPAQRRCGTCRWCDKRPRTPAHGL